MKSNHRNTLNDKVESLRLESKKIKQQSMNCDVNSNLIFDNLKHDEFLTTEQLAARLNVAVQTVRKWRYEKVIPDFAMVKLRRQVRYKCAQVLLWLETREA